MSAAASDPRGELRDPRIDHVGVGQGLKRRLEAPSATAIAGAVAVAGLALVVAGVAMIDAAAGAIVAGLLLLALAVGYLRGITPRSGQRR